MPAVREVLRELVRRRVRSALTAAGIAIGVATLVLLGALAVKMDRLVSGGRDFATGQITVSGAGSGGAPGGMIRGASGVLDGKPATTKREVVPPEPPPIDVMRERHPHIDVREASLVDAGTVVTGGGVSLCIDAMLHLLERLYGDDVARETARILEYHRAWAANREQFPPLVAPR